MEDESPHATLMRMADLLTPSALRAAATLRVADHVAAGAREAAEVARRSGARRDVMDLLLRYLVDLGVLRGGDGSYEVTELGAPLLEEGPASLKEYLSADGMFGRAEMALVHLWHTVRTGEPSHVAAFGEGYWESVNEDPTFAASLERNASSQLGWDAELILDGYDWGAVDRVVDVGGHHGALLLELLRRNPHLRGTLVDLTNCVEVARRRAAQAELTDRFEAVVGSFFDPLVTGADVYVLSAILSDWQDEQAVAILRRCGEAAGPHGRVLLAEVNLPAESAGLQLWLRATMPAPVRTVEELKELGAAAGLRLTWEGPNTSVRSLLEFAGHGA